MCCEDLFALFRVHVPNFWYLETRVWFVRNRALQAKLEQVVNLRQGHLVQVAFGDFEEHIDILLLGYHEQQQHEQKEESPLTFSS